MALDIQQKQSFNLSGLDRSNVTKFKRDIPVRYLPTTRASITIAWLEDNQCPTYVENNVLLHTFLQNDRCFVVFYSNVGKCIKYLNQARSREYVIVVIISHSIEVIHKMIYRLRQHRIVQTIYIVSSERNASDYFSSIIDDIAVFHEKNSMLDRLKSLIDDIEKDNFEVGLFTTFNRKEKALEDVRQELAAFVWNHVFKVLVLSMPCDSLEAKQQMLKECRAYYRNDPAQLSRINEFERTYKPSDAIRWYTKPGFLFYLVNKALRSGDILALYTFRYFIRDLCNRLEKASVTHSDSSFRLYRGAVIHRDEMESLRIGSLVATNGFFSCSRNRNVAEMFIGIDSSSQRSPSRGRDERQQFVLFEIDVDIIRSPDVVVANTNTQSVVPEENEMIFTLGSTFIITHILYDSQRNLWFIYMSSFSDWAKIDQEYDRYIRVRLQLTNPTILFGHALVSIESDYIHSMHYFYRLLRTLSVNHADRPVVYYDLGRIYHLLEKYEKALACFRCARLLLRRLLPETAFDYCRALSGIGTIYSKLGDSKRAINILEQAIILQRKFLPDDHIEIPFHFNRLGYVYFETKQFERALSILYSADKFFQTRLPIDHPAHADTSHTLGLVYCALGDKEKAYKYFKEALRKRDALLAKDHPNIASTCYQLSLIHEDRGEYKIALGYAKRSLRIRSIKLPYYHSGLQQSSELVERLQHRQNVFETA